MISAAILLALSVLLSGGGADVKARLRIPARRHVDRPTTRSADPLAFAFTADVLAACLRSGMAVSTAAAAVAPSAPPAVGALLTRAADLLALGADPAAAWSDPDADGDKHTASLLRLARRSAASGSALARGLGEVAVQSRDDAADAARAAAERAAVLIAGPLGLCYLPAFLCLGVVPVVGGLLGDVLRSGVL